MYQHGPSEFFIYLFFRMADSVGTMSVYRTSDEITDPFCDPCFKDGARRSVVGYCPKCVEFYCQSCLVAHRSMAISAPHKILLGSDMPACQADKPVKYQLCDIHNREDKNRYCFDHSITVCGTCATGKHKQCQVKEVSEASKSFNILAEKKSLSANIDLLLKHVKETSKTIKLNNARLETKRQDILTMAQKQRDDFLEKVNQSYQDFSEEATNLFKEHITILSAHQSALDNIVTEIDTILQSLQQISTKKQNDQKGFLELHYSAEKTRFCEDKIKLLNCKQRDINYTLNSKIQPLIVTKSMFGELSLQTATINYSTKLPCIHYPYTGPRQDPHKTVPGSGAMGGHAVQTMKLTPLDKINVKIPDDKEDCNIWGVDITADGNMLLTDTANCNVKLFSPDGILLSSLKTPVAPIDVTVIKKAEAVISMQQKQIGVIDIEDSSHLSMTHTIKLNRFVWGITNYKNNLIIICCKSNDCPRSVQMIDIDGKILWTATKDSGGKNLFDRARFLTTCSYDDGSSVIVTDRRKQTITVLDAGTGQLVKVCNVKGKSPCGVTADDKGNVYVCYYSGDISLFSRGMQEETLLTTESKYLKNPFAMTYNNRRLELVLTSEAYGTDYYDFIRRFKVSSLR